jgi:hypothetical protein
MYIKLGKYIIRPFSKEIEEKLENKPVKEALQILRNNHDGRKLYGREMEDCSDNHIMGGLKEVMFYSMFGLVPPFVIMANNGSMETGNFRFCTDENLTQRINYDTIIKRDTVLYVKTQFYTPDYITVGKKYKIIKSIDEINCEGLTLVSMGEYSSREKDKIRLTFLPDKETEIYCDSFWNKEEDRRGIKPTYFHFWMDRHNDIGYYEFYEEYVKYEGFTSWLNFPDKTDFSSDLE